MSLPQSESALCLSTAILYTPLRPRIEKNAWWQFRDEKEIEFLVLLYKKRNNSITRNVGRTLEFKY